MKSLFFALSAILVAQPLLAFPTPQKGVPAECGDPTFACQDLQSAKTCGVVTECIHDIWETMSVPDDNDEICDICKEMVKEARDQLLSNMTQEEIKEVFEGSCKLLPVKIIAEGCIKVVDEIIPQLVEMLASRMDPNMVCTVSGMCFPSKKITLKKEVQVKDDLECEFCEHLLEHVKDLITTNTTMDEFKNALLNFCKVTGKFSDKCTSLVNNYYDMLFSYIKNLDSKGMCTLMGLCSNSEHSEFPLVRLIPATKVHKTPLVKLQPAQDVDAFPLVRLVPAKFLSKKLEEETNDVFQPQLPVERFVLPSPILGRDTECALCKAFSFYLETDLAGDRSEDGVQRALDRMCEKWMQGYPDHCRQIMNKYSENIRKAVVNGAAFEELCSQMEACPLEEDPKGNLEVKVLPNIEGSPFCDLCKDAMGEVERELKDPAFKQQLENMLDQVCTMLPKSLKDDCMGFIHQNIDAVISILQEEMKPDNICPTLGLCLASPRLGVTPRVKDLECNICKDVFTSFRQSLQNPSSKEILETFLEEGCIRLPGSYAAECKKFVAENIDTLIKIMVEEMDPETVCKALSICPESMMRSLLSRIPKVKDVECDVCKQVIGQIEDMIKDKPTEDEIKQVLDKVCSYLPSTLSAKCQDFVNKYTDQLISLLTLELDPDVVCAALNLCPENTQLAEEKSKGFIFTFFSERTQSTVEKSKAKDIECQGCQYALHFLQEKLMDAETQTEVKNVLKKMCSVLPETYAKNCDAFIDEFGSSLLVLIAQEMDPSQLCFRLQLCGNQSSIFDNMHKDISLNRFQMDECSVCTTVVDYVDKLVEEDDVDKEITQLVEKVCDVVPSSFRQQCANILETYGPYILQSIGQMANSKQVCQDIDLCPRSPEHVHLLGGRKCTFGPSYWCRSKAHATSCKAESFCKEKVWKN